MLKVQVLIKMYLNDLNFKCDYYIIIYQFIIKQLIFTNTILNLSNKYVILTNYENNLQIVLLVPF